MQQSYYKQTIWMYFQIEDDESLKTKVKSYDDEVTDFYDKGICKMDSNHTSLENNQLGFCSQY